MLRFTNQLQSYIKVLVVVRLLMARYLSSRVVEMTHYQLTYNDLFHLPGLTLW